MFVPEVLSFWFHCKALLLLPTSPHGGSFWKVETHFSKCLILTSRFWRKPGCKRRAILTLLHRLESEYECKKPDLQRGPALGLIHLCCSLRGVAVTYGTAV